MTTPPVTTRPDEPVTPAAPADVLAAGQATPVTSDDGTLIGIVTRADVLSVYSRPDADIQHEIIQDLIQGMFRCDPSRFTGSVTDGSATIEGTAESTVVGRDIIGSRPPR